MKRSILSHFMALTLLLGFLIGIHDGKIGIWKAEDPTPMRTIPCPVWVLSSQQQQMLRNGIRIDSMEDLERMLTDFFS